MKKQSKIKTLRKGDVGFMLNDGVITSPRAGFELVIDMPNTYREVVIECINRGWLKPVAYALEKEYIWDVLCD